MQKKTLTFGDVSVTFAEQKEYESRGKLAYSTWEKHPHAREWLGTLTFESPRGAVPLQTADMLAYEAYKEWEGIEYGELSFKTNFQLRPLLHKITQRYAMHSGGLYGQQALKTAVARFEVGRD